MKKYPKHFLILVLLLNGLIALADNITVGGGSPLMLLEDLQNPNKRMFVVDDNMFIGIIGLVGNQQHEFIKETNLDLQGLMIKDGNSYVSAFRYQDGAEVYFVNKSAYEQLKKQMTIDELVKQLDEKSVAVTLKP
ncbi:MAG: hypothetical protein KBD78_08330 [Oligoflexales bacterium]|nr:hypothetical protein [Oligoflexales bacterium]